MTVLTNSILYVGATTDLIKRTCEHKNKFIPGFIAKYNLHMLVYYEMDELYIEAARREKRFKNWPIIESYWMPWTSHGT
ncbi:GIY-YIG nuclease family protein [Legionella worsleiensis]|uniref:GIY-YIG nuclease family protein n=1 Tax=Legionella worsleiensis TaxID=45076 RepID=UPI000E0F39C5|nr:GIY-YIG nuclease family protein [Legionella worsleiensis]